MSSGSVLPETDELEFTRKREEILRQSSDTSCVVQIPGRTVSQVCTSIGR